MSNKTNTSFLEAMYDQFIELGFNKDQSQEMAQYALDNDMSDIYDVTNEFVEKSADDIRYEAIAQMEHEQLDAEQSERDNLEELNFE